MNNKGADQTAQMRLCCSQTPEDRFSRVEALLVADNFSTSISHLEKINKGSYTKVHVLFKAA